MAKRVAPNADPQVAFTQAEIMLLDRLISDKPGADKAVRSIATYFNKLPRLGGCLARASDPPPGNMVDWRGLSRLTDIHLRCLLASRDVGN